MKNKYQPKEDCFAYTSGICVSSTHGGCAALKEMYCAKEGKCRFYKTKEQHIEDQRRAKRRLAILRGVKGNV